MTLIKNQDRLNELFDSDPRNDTAIASALGVSKQTISMWRHGARSPKKSVLVRIAKEYNVSLEWLMGFDVDRSAVRSTSVVIPDSEMFSKILYYMTKEDYLTVMDIFDRTYRRMKAMGVELDLDKKYDD